MRPMTDELSRMAINERLTWSESLRRADEAARARRARRKTRTRTAVGARLVRAGLRIAPDAAAVVRRVSLEPRRVVNLDPCPEILQPSGR
ncbi:MAG TPA: hypothetical protein VM600_04040 [Actinomycetota bacterium]|nr:hypothetical protein [Actinomycetota bacterium]